MRCAIYARKSTEEPDKHADNKSTTRQVEHAKRFIEERGWTCMEEHVYVDDGISGAEFQNRPGFQALIAALKSKQFDAVVCSEPSRLGRDMTFTAYFVRQITDAEVRIFYYLTGEEEKQVGYADVIYAVDENAVFPPLKAMALVMVGGDIVNGHIFYDPMDPIPVILEG